LGPPRPPSVDDEEVTQLLLALRHLAQCRGSIARVCRFADEPCSRAPETPGLDRHVRSRRGRLFPKARKVFAASLSAFLFFQCHAADRTFAWFIGFDLGMHRARVNFAVLHFHALVLHPLMLHALATFRRVLGLTEFLF